LDFGVRWDEERGSQNVASLIGILNNKLWIQVRLNMGSSWVYIEGQRQFWVSTFTNWLVYMLTHTAAAKGIRILFGIIEFSLTSQSQIYLQNIP